MDHQVCFVGGLDLCFGRYDSGSHQVGDNPSEIWPGKDYYNPRFVLNCTVEMARCLKRLIISKSNYVFS